jgi:hypothetical protein
MERDGAVRREEGVMGVGPGLGRGSDGDGTDMLCLCRLRIFNIGRLVDHYSVCIHSGQ